MGPSLRTWELQSWARSRKLSDADEQQLRAVFEERDRLREVLEEVVGDGEVSAAMYTLPVPQSLVYARAVLQETEP